MNRSSLFVIFILASLFISSDNPNVLPESIYPYWPSYQHLEVRDLDTIQAQKWITHDHVINGWDWSLPDFVEPSQKSMVGLQRIIGWDKDYIPLDLKFKSNSTGILWVKWRDIETTKGNYNFQPILDRISQANSVGSDIILRILCHSKSRSGDISKGEAPLWLEDLGVTLLPQEKPEHNLNFDPSHPEFHKRYLMLVNEMAKTGIPDKVKAAYVGYASHSFGDEGIGPHGENNPDLNDAELHVRERLDAWGEAFKGQEYKVFMGGTSDYGFKKGFGVRRGFVEMYLYHIPSPNLGQYIDEDGYLSVDENAPVLQYKCFNGEVNEEYEEAWATDARSFRFGNTTNSYPYRYFTSNLRALQMRCTYIHTTGHLIPKMLPFISQELGRTVEDAPDVWTFLRTSYIRASTYRNNDKLGRKITADEETEGIETKNFERWLYQRDAPGYETVPAVKIQQAIKMWMVQDNKYYDYIARKGKKIGFDVDDRWMGLKDSIALKVSYFDFYPGNLDLVYHNGEQEIIKKQPLTGDSTLKTATFFISGMDANQMDNNFDFVLKAGEGTDSIVVSFVRVVHADVTSGPLGAVKKVFPDDAWGVYTWGSYDPDNINPSKTPQVKGVPTTLAWRDLEPQKGQFEFDKLIRNKLEDLDKDKYYTTLMVWVAFATTQVSETDTSWAFTPKWLFNNGVPLVEFPETINPLGIKTTRYFPYYFDVNYKFYFHRMISELGKYILNLPDNLRSRILFVQSAEGSTGDGQPYKGSPVDPQYNITKEQWSDFRIETWEKYVEAFSKEGELQIPLLTNYDSNEAAQYNWMLENLPKAIGLKNGMFSHGYHISDAQERLADFIDFRNAVEEQGKVFFARGEQDAEYKTYGWSTQNIPQAFYWSALYATHCGLSLWNIPWEACDDEENFPAFELFNRYAAEVHPQSAKGAFCALRRGLDASDTKAFPENIYGEAVKSNTQRYIDIANSYSEYGANQGDPEKATGGGMENRKREDYNDVGWKILKGNYQRHITQIDPEETSIAWWQIDTSVYGRFARGFDAENGKDTLFFDLDDHFFGDQYLNGDQEVQVEIIYRDGDPGSWKLVYDATNDSMNSAMEVINSGQGDWKTKQIVLKDAYLGNRGPRGADFILVNTGGTNCRFHMIAIDKQGKTEFSVEETTRNSFQNIPWQFPYDTLQAWQFDYILNTKGDTLFSLDNRKTIGIYGCDDNSGDNIRAYADAQAYKDAAQFNWDSGNQTFQTNGQWVEYSAEFDIDKPYQLILKARNNVDAHLKITIFRSNRDTVFYKNVSLKNDFENIDSGNEQTGWYLSKFAVPNLWGMYIVRFDWYDHIGEPGIFGAFSFRESNLDITPPGWYFVTVGNIIRGTNVVVMPTEAAKVFLVQSETLSIKDSIEQAAIAVTEVNAYTQGFLATSGIPEGNYVVYAIDNAGNISEPSRLIIIQSPVNAAVISNHPGIEIFYNQTDKLIGVKSNYEIKQVNIYDITGKMIRSISGYGNECSVRLGELTLGIYFVHVFDRTGNIEMEKLVVV